MFCGKCGAQVNEGEQFCSSCGAQVSGSGVSQQQGQQQAYSQQPDYGQQQPYGGQYVYQQPPKKKSLKALWISIAVVLVLAIAAVVLFVYSGVITGGAGGGILSGNTTQTKFVNDSVKVFENAFSGMSSDTMNKMAQQPFDLTMDVSANILGTTQKMTLDAAYDKHDLGISIDASGQSVNVLLLEDALYIAENGEVKGIKLNSTTDLSKPMSLEDRLTAIIKDLSNATGKTIKTQLDYKKLAEMLVNSIDESCFDKSSSEVTLTLTMKDVINTLNTFSDKLDKDKALSDSLNDYLKEATGQTIDVATTLKSSLSMLSSQLDSTDFKLVWTVSYDNGAPNNMEIKYTDESNDVDVTFGYDKKESGNDIDLGVTSNGNQIAKLTFSYEKKADGLDYSGTVVASGQSIAIDGNEKQSGDKITGNMTLTNQGEKVSIDYDETLKFGMPSKNVQDDSRFKVDTSSADMEDITSLFGSFGSSY